VVERERIRGPRTGQTKRIARRLLTPGRTPVPSRQMSRRGTCATSGHSHDFQCFLRFAGAGMLPSLRVARGRS
jgi:hypothetical protein